jgi:hypothetical protein
MNTLLWKLLIKPVVEPVQSILLKIELFKVKFSLIKYMQFLVTVTPCGKTGLLQFFKL